MFTGVEGALGCRQYYDCLSYRHDQELHVFVYCDWARRRDATWVHVSDAGIVSSVVRRCWQYHRLPWV